jgi:hypothetical protein
MPKNAPKYQSYKEAWRRIDSAMAGGFFFEVVTICESIISDRLLSFVRGVTQANDIGTNTNFSQLIRLWRENVQIQSPESSLEELIDRVDRWRKERNKMVHGFVKSLPGTATMPVNQFLADAQKAADEGMKLARMVSAWHRSELRQYRSRAASSISGKR